MDYKLAEGRRAWPTWRNDEDTAEMLDSYLNEKFYLICGKLTQPEKITVITWLSCCEPPFGGYFIGTNVWGSSLRAYSTHKLVLTSTT